MSYSEPAAPEPTAPEGVELFSLDPETNRHPQEMYRTLRATAPVLSLDGMGHVLTTKEAAMEAFRRPEVFSSAATVDTLAMGSVRPLIPLQIDPPDHVKYRKILDPLFAPKRMDAIEGDIAGRVNHFIDQFADRGSCHFTDELAVPFPSAVFLGLMGLPWEELDTLVGELLSDLVDLRHRLQAGSAPRRPDVHDNGCSAEFSKQLLELLRIEGWKARCRRRKQRDLRRVLRGFAERSGTAEPALHVYVSDPPTVRVWMLFFGIEISWLAALRRNNSSAVSRARRSSRAHSRSAVPAVVTVNQ